MLIPNGVDCSQYAGDEPLPGRSRGTTRSMFLGRIDEPRKGLPILLAALPRVAAAIPDVKLLVAGPGRRREPSGPSSTRALAERVEFLGSGQPGGQGPRPALGRHLRRAQHGRGVLRDHPARGDGGRGARWWPATSRPSSACSTRAARACTSPTRTPRTWLSASSGCSAIRGRRDALRAAGLARAAEFDWSSVARKVVAVYHSVTPGGEKVTADLSGQFWGRLPVRARGRGRRSRGGRRREGRSHLADHDPALVAPVVVMRLSALASGSTAAPPDRALQGRTGRTAAPAVEGGRGAGDLRARGPGQRDRAGQGGEQLPQRRPRRPGRAQRRRVRDVTRPARGVRRRQSIADLRATPRGEELFDDLA